MQSRSRRPLSSYQIATRYLDILIAKFGGHFQPHPYGVYSGTFVTVPARQDRTLNRYWLASDRSLHSVSTASIGGLAFVAAIRLSVLKPYEATSLRQTGSLPFPSPPYRCERGLGPHCAVAYVRIHQFIVRRVNECDL